MKPLAAVNNWSPESILSLLVSDQAPILQIVVVSALVWLVLAGIRAVWGDYFKNAWKRVFHPRAYKSERKGADVMASLAEIYQQQASGYRLSVEALLDENERLLTKVLQQDVEISLLKRSLKLPVSPPSRVPLLTPRLVPHPPIPTRSETEPGNVSLPSDGLRG